MIHSRVSWMCLPVDRSITVSPPQRIAQTSFSTSSAMPELTALLPMLALTLVRKLRPMIIGSLYGGLMLLGMIARPRAIAWIGLAWGGEGAGQLGSGSGGAVSLKKKKEKKM